MDLRRKGGFLDTFVFLTKENNGCTRTPYIKKPEMSSVKDLLSQSRPYERYSCRFFKYVDLGS